MHYLLLLSCLWQPGLRNPAVLLLTYSLTSSFHLISFGSGVGDTMQDQRRLDFKYICPPLWPWLSWDDWRDLGETKESVAFLFYPSPRTLHSSSLDDRPPSHAPADATSPTAMPMHLPPWDEYRRPLSWARPHTSHPCASAFFTYPAQTLCTLTHSQVPTI